MTRIVLRVLGTKTRPGTDREERPGFDVNTHVSCASGNRPPPIHDFVRNKYPAYDEASCKVAREAQLILPGHCSNGFSSSWVHRLFDCANGSRVVDFKSGGPTLAHNCRSDDVTTQSAVTRQAPTKIRCPARHLHAHDAVVRDRGEADVASAEREQLVAGGDEQRSFGDRRGGRLEVAVDEVGDAGRPFAAASLRLHDRTRRPALDPRRTLFRSPARRKARPPADALRPPSWLPHDIRLGEM